MLKLYRLASVLLPAHFTAQGIRLARQTPLLGQIEAVYRLLLADTSARFWIGVIDFGYVSLGIGPTPDVGLNAFALFAGRL